MQVRAHNLLWRLRRRSMIEQSVIYVQHQAFRPDPRFPQHLHRCARDSISQFRQEAFIRRTRRRDFSRARLVQVILHLRRVRLRYRLTLSHRCQRALAHAHHHHRLWHLERRQYVLVRRQLSAGSDVEQLDSRRFHRRSKLDRAFELAHGGVAVHVDLKRRRVAPGPAHGDFHHARGVDKCGKDLIYSWNELVKGRLRRRLTCLMPR